MWPKSLCMCLLPAMLVGAWRFTNQDTEAGAQPKAEPMEYFSIDELREQARTENRAYLSFLERSTLSTGLYRLAAGAKDGQSPHGQDEVYYVLAGRSQFEVEGKSRNIAPGAVLFVAAGAEHRFFDIEEDLELLVFFSKAEPGDDAKER